MAKVVAITSMSLDGFVADPADGVEEVFRWYGAGGIDVPTAKSDFVFHSPMAWRLPSHRPKRRLATSRSASMALTRSSSA